MLKIFSHLVSMFAKSKNLPIVPKEPEPPQQKTPNVLEASFAVDGAFNIVNNNEPMDKEALLRIEADHQDVVRFHNERDAALGITLESKIQASDFFRDNLKELKVLDETLGKHTVEKNFTLALEDLQTIKDFCFQRGESGRIFFKQSYEQLYNSKLYCFTYEYLIQTQMLHEQARIQHEGEIEAAYPEILQCLKDKSPMLQKDLYSLYPTFNRQVIIDITLRMIKDGIIIKTKQGRYNVLTVSAKAMNVL